MKKILSFLLLMAFPFLVYPVGNGGIFVDGVMQGPIEAGTLTLNDGSITDSSGAISFGDENLSTTGTLGAGATTLSGDLDMGTNSIDGDSSSGLSFDVKNDGTNDIRFTLGSDGATPVIYSPSVGNLTLLNSNSRFTFEGNEYVGQQQDGTVAIMDDSEADGVLFNTDGSTGLMKTVTYVDDALADDGYFDLPDATSGFGRVICNAEYFSFYVRNAGQCYITGNSANGVAADTDAKLCIFDNGTNARVRNRLGAAGEIRIIYWYN